MRIVTLVENTCGHEGCIAEHGLSLYIETEKHKLLLDTGQTDAVVKNAGVLRIDLSAVDTVILSHGHHDHSGGILPFSKLNHTAQIISLSSIRPQFHEHPNRPYCTGIPAFELMKQIMGGKLIALHSGEQVILTRQ